MNFTMYSTKWCGYCQRLKRDLRDVGIDFEEVDIEQVRAQPSLLKKPTTEIRQFLLSFSAMAPR